ncbi:hypothetical protein [uncultured Sphaerotilus sp.]|uniref:hypothetical protein n=1 Tax=uncultured Sphaerotilus sp. TaxID=474984 RepID=UPI0030CA2744
MSRIEHPPNAGGELSSKPSIAIRRKLGKVPPVAPGMLGSRSITCSMCQRKILSNLLLAHKQEAHGDAIYSRTATGRPKSIWFRPPPPSPAPAWRRPAALRPVFTR